MATENKYGHTADGNKPSERAEKHHYDYCIISENIAYLYSSEGLSPEEVATRFASGWENSPEHRKNMLDPDVTETGVAVAQSKKTGYYFAVQMFGRPKSLRIEFELVNRSPATIQYHLGGRLLTLPTNYRRIHTLCRPTEVSLSTADSQDPKKEHVFYKFQTVPRTSFEIAGKAGQLSVQKAKMSAAEK
jgi:hypothetical protein